MFKPISDNVALSQKIVSQITDAIIRGELHPGVRLPTERELAEQFKVSRTAIRDAIKLLAGRGLLTVRHGVGIFVAESTNADSEEAPWMDLGGANLRDVFEIRKALETQAAYFAALRASEDHIDRLESILRDAWEHQDDLMVLNQRDAQFHTVIAEASENLLLVRVMWTLLGALDDARSESLRIPKRPIASLSEHESILEAIKAQSADEARLRMLNHLESVESAVVDQIVSGS